MTNIQKRELNIFVFNNMFENIKINFKLPNNIYFHFIKFSTFIYSHKYSINEFEDNLTGIKAFAEQDSRSCAGHGGALPKSLDSDENFKPEHTLFCRDIKICRD